MDNINKTFDSKKKKKNLKHGVFNSFCCYNDVIFFLQHPDVINGEWNLHIDY